MSNGLPTGKKRRICHYSMDGDVPSINSMIDDALAKIEYQTTAHLQKRILDLAESGITEISIFKCDIKSAFRVIPLRPQDWTQGRPSARDGKAVLRASRLAHRG